MVRIKHRYLLLNILFPDGLSATPSSSSNPGKPFSLTFHSPTPSHFQAASLVNLIRESVAELFGDYGIGIIAGLKIMYFSPATSTAIVRCPRASYRVVWAALTFMGSLPGARRGSAERVGCVIRVVRVSGTIRKAEEEAVRRARAEIVRVKMSEQEGGEGSGTVGLDKLLRLGQGGDSALDRDDEEAGIEDMSDGAEDMDDDSGRNL
jgi:ribonuclease P/MRP protein subunit POP5